MTPSAHEQIKVAIGILADAQAAGTTNGPSIDRAGFRDAVVVLNSGTNAATGTADVKVQESADASSWADITGAVFAQITTSNDNTVYVGHLNLNGRKRYLRVVSVVALAACELSVEVLLLGAHLEPVTQVNAVSFSVLT